MIVARDSVGIAARRTAVTGRDDGGDALRGGLLPQIDVEGFVARTDAGFAGAEALAEDRSDVVVDDIDCGKVGAKQADAFRIFGDDEVNLRARSDGAGPLRVEIGFDFVVGGRIRALDAWVGTIEDHVDGGCRRKTKHRAKLRVVGGVDVGVLHDGDGHARAGSYAADRGGGVVNRGEVARADGPAGCRRGAGAAAVKGEERFHYAGVLRLAEGAEFVHQ